MRLLLDEQYSHQIAVHLRAAGHDVEATAETPALVGMGDEELLSYASDQGRALLTNNVRHFAPLAREWTARGQSHPGLVFTSEESMPRSRATIGRYVEAITALMEAHPAADALRDRVHWLG